MGGSRVEIPLPIAINGPSLSLIHWAFYGNGVPVSTGELPFGGTDLKLLPGRTCPIILAAQVAEESWKRVGRHYMQTVEFVEE